MDKKNKKTEEKAGFDIDLGAGKISLGGIFKEISNLVDLAAKLQQEGKSEFSRTGEIKGLGDKDVKAVYGFTVKLGGLAGESPRVETFGNIKKDGKGAPVVEEVREPLVDIFDEADKITIIAEIPGVEEKKIKIDLKGDILELKTENSDKKYHKEILLPSKVKEESLGWTYKNGVLEITLTK
ncbi:MAG: Hsp20/alpha crystallin family protein [candidate division Zixibacteria bacterium]|nr:Hsp20/alpha crystallin family protein [candidate division Zixibacteria bacterium]